MFSDFTDKPELGRFMAGGLVAGLLSALLNSAYYVSYRGITGFRGEHPTLSSIVVSSIVPSLLGALGCYALARFTRKAPLLFAIVTGLITLASFEGAFRSTLPDGSLKPTGFDALVMPMHAVVGLSAALLIALIARRRLVLCWPS